MDTSDALPFQHVEFASSDWSVAGEFIDRMYGARLDALGRAVSGRPLSASARDYGSFSSGVLQLPAALTFTMRGGDHVVIDSLLKGTVEVDPEGAARRYQRGDVFIVNHGEADYTLRADHVSTRAVSVSLDLIAEVSAADPDGPGRAWSPESMEPVAGGARRWNDVTRYVDDVLSGPGMAEARLIIGQAGRMLAATVLTVFPHKGSAAGASSDRSDAHPAALRRAISYIEANPDVDISVQDVARAAHVSARAVQIAFRLHLDTTPMSYLRRVRLDRAHVELRASTPGDGTTVAAVAARWGYARASRFAADYRAAYGDYPHQALRGEAW